MRATVSATSEYNRQDAVGDGFLIDISARYPNIANAHPGKELYVTDRVWEIVEKSADNPKTASSREGILHDIIWMSRLSIDENKDQFRVLINGIRGKPSFPLRWPLFGMRITMLGQSSYSQRKTRMTDQSYSNRGQQAYK